MNNKVCLDHFNDNYYDYVREHCTCRQCHGKTLTKFINRHGRIVAKCDRLTCGSETWVGVYQDNYKGFLGHSFYPGIQFDFGNAEQRKTKFVDR